jgi:hypothetical protein
VAVTLTGHSDPVWDLTLVDVAGRPALLGAGEDDAVHLWLVDALGAVSSHDDFAAARWVVTNVEETARGLVGLRDRGW